MAKGIYERKWQHGNIATTYAVNTREQTSRSASVGSLVDLRERWNGKPSDLAWVR